MKFLTEGLLHKLCPCFDIVFGQLGVIPRTRNKFVEIVAVAGGYLIITHVKNKESKKQPFWMCLPVIICLSWWKNINKKGRNFFVPSLQYCQFRQENFTIEKICGYFEWCSIKDLLIFRLWLIIFYTRKSSLTNIYLFKVNDRSTKKMWNMFKVNNKNTRTTFYCIYC